MTTQEQMEALLRRCGVPSKRVHCYGSQVMVTCWSREAAEKFHGLLWRFCAKVRGPWEAQDTNQENRGTCLCPTTHVVWRVWGTV